MTACHGLPVCITFTDRLCLCSAPFQGWKKTCRSRRCFPERAANICRLCTYSMVDLDVWALCSYMARVVPRTDRARAGSLASGWGEVLVTRMSPVDGCTEAGGGLRSRPPRLLAVTVASSSKAPASCCLNVVLERLERFQNHEWSFTQPINESSNPIYRRPFALCVGDAKTVNN